MAVRSLMNLQCLVGQPILQFSRIGGGDFSLHIPNKK